jgi:hypothetical protein
MTAATTMRSLDPARPLLAQVLDRAADPDMWERFQRQLRGTGYCRRPVRLRGQVDAIDLQSGEVQTAYSTAGEPDETLLKCCGNRREAVCPTCARTYRGDAFQLVAAGLRGGKGVPETVAEHPMIFLTLTAPSFGPVHSRRLATGGKARRCRPRRHDETCPHGVSLACGQVHDDGDPHVGEPMCAECFDYEHAVLWNAMAPELWRRTAIQIPRELARLTGVTLKRLRQRVRVSYVKVAEYQRRGALHFHVLIRLDAAQPPRAAEQVEAPPAAFTCELLTQAALAAVEHVSASSPTPDGDATGARVIRWGRQTAVRPIQTASAHEAAAAAAYIAKYATKSTEAAGGLMHRLDAAELRTLRVRPHVRRLVECAWRLGAQEHLEELRLRRWAHALGFRGHCFTKSRRYSTTFTALRQARHDHVLRRVHRGEPRDPWGRPVSEGASVEHRRWAYTGTGHKTAGDAWLAETGAARAAERRRIAREEVRSSPAGVVLSSDVQHNDSRRQL